MKSVKVFKVTEGIVPFIPSPDNYLYTRNMKGYISLVIAFISSSVLFLYFNFFMQSQSKSKQSITYFKLYCLNGTH